MMASLTKSHSNCSLEKDLYMRKRTRGNENIRTFSTVYKTLFVFIKMPKEITIKKLEAIQVIGMSGVKNRLSMNE
ncbi:hypothetical protein J6TS1_26110 [Siminovitchia terrae]|uniref:Uncharacterized protein n=1 Tax=Siminovitchia terrae TaxID=1914933 RepID=A0ABQ4KXQ7_SIMTE|nr:hypothetical protein J22TS1_50370 [Siminovitchia terrae]GIN96741.1 hypothetical protein J6TS1_26110 [Siminovitchia terrae]